MQIQYRPDSVDRRSVALGLSGKELSLSESSIKKAPDQGKLIVCSMRPGILLPPSTISCSMIMMIRAFVSRIPTDQATVPAPGLCHALTADQAPVSHQPHWFLTISARIFAVPSMPNRLLSIMKSLWSKTLCQPGM